MPESVEHTRIKERITDWLKVWVGAGVKEYQNSGHRLDVYAVTLSGVRICAEVIWSPSPDNFHRDLNLVLMAEADVKLVVASPAVIKKDTYQRELSMAATHELRTNTALYGEFIDGQKILNETRYADVVRSVVTKLVESRNKTINPVEEYAPPPNPSSYLTSEILLSNLFQVKSIPSTVFSSQTRVRLDDEVFAGIRERRGTTKDTPAFILKLGRLFSFDDLRNPGSVFSWAVSSSHVLEENTSEWVDGKDKRSDLIRFLNLSLRNYILQRPNIRYDRHHRRFWFLLDDGKDNLFTWKTASGRTSRRVLAKKVFSANGRPLYCWHHSAEMRFILVDDTPFLKIEPTFAFTLDGFAPIPGYRIPSLMSRRAPMQYNNAYRDTVRLWIKWTSKRDIEINIPAAQQRITIDPRPISTRLGVGIRGD